MRKASQTSRKNDSILNALSHPPTHAHTHLSEVRKLTEVASITSGQMRIALETAVGPSVWPPNHGAVEKRGTETKNSFGRAGLTCSYFPLQAHASRKPVTT